jgi:hemerythrin-like domain-containing protein
MLLACHQRVERMLSLLERLALHVAAKGCDGVAAQAANDVLRYFDQAGPAHHEDEERHVFPALRGCGNPETLVLVKRLQQEHLTMSQQWSAVRADLLNVIAGEWSAQLASARAARWAVFVAMYRSHIVAEESWAYPAARPLLDGSTLAAMGREMAERRGARWPSS